MLWVGWFGFNAGSALAVNGTAGMAALVTHLSPWVAALTWMAIEWTKFGKASMLGFATGAIAGLAAITPAAGTVGPAGAVAIGLASGVLCYYGATSLKRWGGYDDSLDAFGVHGVGGFVGTMLAGVFASAALGGSIPELAIGRQLVVQFCCAVAAGLWSALVALLALKIADVLVGVRVDESEERGGKSPTPWCGRQPMWATVLAGMAALALLARPAAAGAATRPNILVVLVDDAALMDFGYDAYAAAMGVQPMPAGYDVHHQIRVNAIRKQLSFFGWHLAAAAAALLAVGVLVARRWRARRR
jgi:hypothetical protein